MKLPNGIEINFDDGIAHIESYSEAAVLEDVFQSLENDDVHPYSFPDDFLSSHDHFETLTEEAFTSIDIPSAYIPVAHFLLDDGELYLEPKINHSMLKHLANARGQLRIADDLLAIELDEIVVIPYGEFSDFAEHPRLSPNASVINISGTQQKVDIASCREDYESKRRIRGQLERNTGFLGSTQTCKFRIKTNHYSKGFAGAWFGKKIEKIQHEADIALQSGGFISGNGQTFNRSSLNTLIYDGSCLTISYGWGGSVHRVFKSTTSNSPNGSCNANL